MQMPFIYTNGLDLHLFFIISIMRIIKIQVEVIIDRTIQIRKYAVSLDKKRYSKINQFINHVKKICKLDDEIYQLEYEGFIVPKNDKTKALQEDTIYKLKICRNNSHKKDYQIKSSQLESEEEEDVNYESGRKNKNDRSNSQKKSKMQQKLQKIKRKNKNKSSSVSGSEQSSNSSSEQEEESSSSSSSQSQLDVKRKVRIDENSNNNYRQQPLQKQTKKSNQKPLLQKEVIAYQTKLTKQKVPENKKNPFIQRKVQSSSSSSQSQLQKAPVIKQSKNKVSITTKTAQVVENASKAQAVNNKPKQNQSVLKNIKKAVIEDSSSQSQPSQTPPAKKPVINTKAVEPNIVDKPKSDIKLPPALRNKFVKKNFDQHKQNQWISIDKQSLKKWQQLGNKTVSQTNNKIRFKIVELDQQKFIPVKSGWIIGEVKGVESSGVINLVKVEQQGRPYQQKYDIPQHNMDELQLNRLLATKQQIQFFQRKESQPQKQQNKQQNKQQIVQQKPQQKKDEASNDKNSIEKYICGQANYYFSDKNYNFDLFMQMHANRHPQKYLNLSILLNFPKIKKMIYDKQKLYQYLKEDEKYSQRTYEIDFQNQLIRKKGIFIEPRKEIQPEEGQLGGQSEVAWPNNPDQ